MEQYFIFVLIATLVTVATEAWKKVYDEVVMLVVGAKEWYDINVAIPLPMVLGLFGVITFGQGILGVYLSGYSGLGLKLFDIFITGSITSLGANALYEIYDALKGKQIEKK